MPSDSSVSTDRIQESERSVRHLEKETAGVYACPQILEASAETSAAARNIRSLFLDEMIHRVNDHSDELHFTRVSKQPPIPWIF